MWCAGKTPQEIACELGLKARTVRGHIANLRMRLNVDNNQHLVMKAIHFGLVRPNG
jgi:DNA-binding CsgD family transcriptional regulator